ncbi:PEP-CTERM sorting domain-containing protein [Candidatus Poribacteria bacterium]|nr:PEP-CTERM sorting domain-containing protein [Candidatus Poribacteria bacterium]
MKGLIATLGLGLLCAFSLGAWAIPSLQLYFDPAFSENTNAVYDTVDEGWETDGNSVILTTFMIPENGGGGGKVNLGDNFRVIISLPGRASAPNGLITVGVSEKGTTEGTLTVPPVWTFGDADMQPHGIFDAWFTTFDFTFVGAPTAPNNNATVFDVQTGGGSKNGFRDDFLITFSGADSNSLYHFDLVDTTTGLNGGHWKNFAPFSHDAQRNISGGTGGDVNPEPSTAILLGVGLFSLVGIAIRKKIKK